MKIPTEFKIFVVKQKPRTFYEYIADRLTLGLDINLRKKEEFDVLECLQVKRAGLVAEKQKVVDHEEDIKKALADFETKLRAEYEKQDAERQAKLDNQIEVVDELIKECEAKANAEENTTESEASITTSQN